MIITLNILQVYACKLINSIYRIEEKNILLKVGKTENISVQGTGDRQ